ncbi:hypothetical protein E2C01_032868 [Portunus trituberculatus]|uniref:Uncharacterized protein n=1 Tax=Portunus trituberculatus TaxID=210409 RepID=A0A5B7F0R8_PORTR|nr:hypothetical protein [Portunus trituberculatus]
MQLHNNNNDEPSLYTRCHMFPRCQAAAHLSPTLPPPARRNHDCLVGPLMTPITAQKSVVVKHPPPIVRYTATLTPSGD